MCVLVLLLLALVSSPEWQNNKYAVKPTNYLALAVIRDVVNVFKKSGQFRANACWLNNNKMAAAACHYFSFVSSWLTLCRHCG